MLHIRRLLDNQVNAERPRAEMLGLRTVQLIWIGRQGLHVQKLKCSCDDVGFTHHSQEVGGNISLSIWYISSSIYIYNEANVIQLK